MDGKCVFFYENYLPILEKFGMNSKRIPNYLVSPVGILQEFLKNVDKKQTATAIKGGFFSERAIRFSNLQISKTKIFQKTILGLKFKFQVQDSFLEI
jgi:hypothetical protein